MEMTCGGEGNAPPRIEGGKNLNIYSMNQSVKKQKRNSSIELFRILAMFLVLVVHLNGDMIKMPPHFNYDNTNMIKIGQTIIEAFSINCVNCFLIISGFYGIKLTAKKIWNLYTLIVCIYVPFYIIETIRHGNFTVYGLIDQMLSFSKSGYFVQCYIMLMFLSPILNAFIDRYSRKHILIYVLIFWCIEFWSGCIRGNDWLGINRGFSLIHFVLIYMLARTAYLYKNKIISIKRHWWFYSYALCIIGICMMYLLGVKWTWHYSNPLVVVSAFCLFFSFLYKTYYKKYINWIASSTFAVYLIHTQPLPYRLLSKCDNFLLENFQYSLYLLCVAIIIITVFTGSILYDKIRIKLTSRIFDRIWDKIETKISKRIIY